MNFFPKEWAPHCNEISLPSYEHSAKKIDLTPSALWRIYVISEVHMLCSPMTHDVCDIGP